MEDLKTMILCDAKRLADMGDCIDRRLFELVCKAQRAGVDLTYTRRPEGVCIINPEFDYMGGVINANTATDIALLALATIQYIEKMEETVHA